MLRVENSEEWDSKEDVAAAVENVMLPGKSKKHYDKEYKCFMEWRKQNQMQKLSENVLLAYFSSKAKIFKSSSLWSKYSMLKATLNLRDNVDISKFPKLIALLKRQAVGYKAKKSRILTRPQIRQFLLEAPDEQYLLIKVALIIGVFGACRCNELCKMVIEDIQEAGSFLIVQIPDSKTKISRTFTVVGNIDGIDAIAIYKKYAALRRPNTPHCRFFVNYRAERCTIQVVGIHSFSKMPSLIAKYLKINDAAAFTGHCFRRSSASLIANSRNDILTLKRHARWKSSAVAEDYVENKIGIANEIAGGTNNTVTEPPINFYMPANNLTSPAQPPLNLFITINNLASHTEPSHNLSVAINNLASNLTEYFSNSSIASVNFGNINNCIININITDKNK